MKDIPRSILSYADRQTAPATLEETALATACRRLHLSKKLRGSLTKYFNVERCKAKCAELGLAYEECRNRNGSVTLDVRQTDPTNY